MGILKSSKSKTLVANNESSKNSTGESSNKGKGKKKKWKDNKQVDTENSPPTNKKQVKSSPNTNKRGTIIRKRSVPIVKELLMTNINVITRRLMN